VTQDGSLANREWLFPSQSGYAAPRCLVADERPWAGHHMAAAAIAMVLPERSSDDPGRAE
jgi:hypothetical protein